MGRRQVLDGDLVEGRSYLWVSGVPHHGHGGATYEGVVNGVPAARCDCGDTVFGVGGGVLAEWVGEEDGTAISRLSTATLYQIDPDATALRAEGNPDGLAARYQRQGSVLGVVAGQSGLPAGKPDGDGEVLVDPVETGEGAFFVLAEVLRPYEG